MTPLRVALVPLVAALACGCGSRTPEQQAPVARVAAPDAATSPGAIATPVAEAEPLVVAYLGDSLTAGYGLPVTEAYPSLLERDLASAGLRVTTLNAGVSGDTTATGLARLDWILAQRPDVIVLALGANDGLRGLPIDAMEANLREAIARTRAANAQVLLVGMLTPENMGRDYAKAFGDAFPRIASDTGVPLVPFLLEGVALVPELNQDDGMHPTAAGQELMAANVRPRLEPLLRALHATR